MQLCSWNKKTNKQKKSPDVAFAVSLSHKRFRARPYGRNIPSFCFFLFSFPHTRTDIICSQKPCSSCKKNGLLIINGFMWIRGYNDPSLLFWCINIRANQQYKSTLTIFHWQRCYKINQKFSMHLEITLVIPYFFTTHISHLLISKAYLLEYWNVRYTHSY